MPITPVSDLLGEAVLAEVRDGDPVLDTGTGSGANAVLAAGRAREVLAVDINPEALTPRDNAPRNDVTDRVVMRHSDVFDEGRRNLRPSSSSTRRSASSPRPTSRRPRAATRTTAPSPHSSATPAPISRTEPRCCCSSAAPATCTTFTSP
ncbi:50S ribosomal protein L11 methyltransferase [Actinosynnema sp. NPDC023587]|uniref:50S ribosomal protein L11 methyltransferase n=1 Tax=Actinosynnema sp. NPDC023587 TaxID=3154695 RepID=UPI00340D28FC